MAIAAPEIIQRMGNDLEPENLTVGQIFKAMKVTHLWGIIVALCAIIVTAYKAGQMMANMEAKTQTFTTQMANEKEEFLVRSLRYETTRRLVSEGDVPNDEFEDLIKQHELADKMYVDLITKWWTNQNDLEGGQIHLKRIIRKGWNPKDSKVIFADGTSWPIPPEIKEKVLENE